jgi:ABC-2 type transport system permease protein
VLDSLRGALSLYGRYIAISMRGQLQYRASFAMLALGQLVGAGVEFVGIWALFHRFGALGS